MTETIAELIVHFISFIFGFMKDVDLSPLADALEVITPYIQAALYLLPAHTIAQIFAITCAIYSVRLTIKAVILLWNLLPIA